MTSISATVSQSTITVSPSVPYGVPTYPTPRQAHNNPSLPELNWDRPELKWGEQTVPPEQPAVQHDSRPASYFSEPLKRNNALDRYAADKSKPFMSATQHTSEHVAAQIKQKWGADVDPEKTFLVTFAYDKNTTPHKAVITQKISLADAARLNIQHTPRPKGMTGKQEAPEGQPTEPFDIQPNSRHTEKPNWDGTFPRPLVGNFNTYYHGIVAEPSPDAPATYGAGQHVQIPPADFKKMVWEHAYKKPYDQYLNFKWSPETRESYTALAKVSYLNAAHAQHHERSLDEEGTKIAMSLVGIPANQTYLDAGLETLVKPHTPDPSLETKFLSFNGFHSTDIFYTRNVNTQKTLLYIPGNSSPIHSFDSPQAMNKWLASQLIDDDKAAVFKKHFSPKDAPSSLFKKGFDARLELIRQHIKEPGAVDFLEGQGYWKEGGVFDGKKITGDPFKEVQEHTEKSMKASTDQEFVLNTDHNKQTILKAKKWLDGALLLATPIGLALPPVGVVLTALSVGSGLLEAGVGIHDKANDRANADDRITFGVFNAFKPLFTAGVGKAAEPITGPIKTVLKATILSK